MRWVYKLRGAGVSCFCSGRRLRTYLDRIEGQHSKGKERKCRLNILVVVYTLWIRLSLLVIWTLWRANCSLQSMTVFVSDYRVDLLEGPEAVYLKVSCFIQFKFFFFSFLVSCVPLWGGVERISADGTLLCVFCFVCLWFLCAQFSWTNGEVWVRLTGGGQKGVELPVDEFTVRVGTGKGRTAGIVNFKKGDLHDRHGELSKPVMTGDEVCGSLQLSYARRVSVGGVSRNSCPAENITLNASSSLRQEVRT